jgi:hypothetical protein
MGSDKILIVQFGSKEHLEFMHGRCSDWFQPSNPSQPSRAMTGQVPLRQVSTPYVCLNGGPFFMPLTLRDIYYFWSFRVKILPGLGNLTSAGSTVGIYR